LPVLHTLHRTILRRLRSILLHHRPLPGLMFQNAPGMKEMEVPAKHGRIIAHEAKVREQQAIHKTEWFSRPVGEILLSQYIVFDRHQPQPEQGRPAVSAATEFAKRDTRPRHIGIGYDGN